MIHYPVPIFCSLTKIPGVGGGGNAKHWPPFYEGNTYPQGYVFGGTHITWKHISLWHRFGSTLVPRSFHPEDERPWEQLITRRSSDTPDDLQKGFRAMQWRSMQINPHPLRPLLLSTNCRFGMLSPAQFHRGRPREELAALSVPLRTARQERATSDSRCRPSKRHIRARGAWDRRPGNGISNASENTLWLSGPTCIAPTSWQEIVVCYWPIASFNLV